MATLASKLIGTWRLVSREDRTAAGERRTDPGLGADPLGILIYDAAGNFAAQFMRRDRTQVGFGMPRSPVLNNSVAIGGYDAYFGTYDVDESAGTVTQRLVGALSPDDVGKVVSREMSVDGDRLTIQLASAGAGGEKILRTLIWERARP